MKEVRARVKMFSLLTRLLLDREDLHWEGRGGGEKGGGERARRGEELGRGEAGWPKGGEGGGVISTVERDQAGRRGHLGVCLFVCLLAVGELLATTGDFWPSGARKQPWAAGVKGRGEGVLVWVMQVGLVQSG